MHILQLDIVTNEEHRLGADGSMKSNFAMKLKENSTIKIITGGEAKVLPELGAGGPGPLPQAAGVGKE